MEKKDLENLLADDVWQDPYLVKGFMDEVMRTNIPVHERDFLKNCDESYGQYNNGVVYDQITINDESGRSGLGIDRWLYGRFGTDANKSNIGGNIRDINKFLENIDKCPTDRLTTSLRNQNEGQMLVLRACLYFDMVRSYGGVPLILHEQRLDEDLNVERAKTSECIAAIVADLDAAIAFGDDFPMQWTGNDAGRISRAVALALKGRVLLYYASPQFSKETPAGTKSAEVRWTEAYNACKDAKDQLAAAGYGLMHPSPASFDEAVENLKDIFVTEIGGGNTEVIWAKKYNYPNYTMDWDKQIRPTSSGGEGQEVTLEMANAFLNANGSEYTGLSIPAGGAPDVSLVTTPAHFWIGREPRFYTNIGYNGCIWSLFREVSYAGDEDGTGRMRHQWTFDDGVDPYDNSRRMELGGLRIRKMIDDKQRYWTSDGNRCGTDWVLCRYAEVLLNFAEAAAKTGKPAEAIQVLKDIRKRAGIPAGDGNYGLSASLTGDALILAILKERQLELTFEGFRYHDLRRWRLFTDEIAGFKLNGTRRHTVKPKLKNELDPDALAAADIDANPSSYFDLFTNHIYSFDAQDISFGEREYFYRISYEKNIRINPNLKQTNLWEGGTFNPYE
jgi:hypothetical protein